MGAESQTLKAKRSVPQLQKGRGEMRRDHMNRAKEILSNLLNEDSGQDLIEYALIIAAFSFVAIAAEASITPKIQNEFNMITSHF